MSRYALASIADLERDGALLDIQDGNHGELHPKSSDYVGTGIPFVMANDIDHDGFLDIPGCNRISEDQAARLRIGFAKSGDVLLTHKATLGRASLLGNVEPFVVLTPQVTYYRTNEALLHNRFLRYAFRDPLFQARMLNVGDQGTRKYIGITAQRLLKITYPTVRVQQRIARLLGAYDELIENNRRRMVLLEDAARQLYQEWFVRLRFPGHENARIVNGLPAGWTRKSLSEIAEFRLGKMLDQTKNRGDLMPYLANVNVRWGGFDLRDLRQMRFEHDELEAFGLKYGDIVMCEGGEPGRCAIWKEQMPGMMIQKAIHRIRARNNMHYVYLYYSLRHQGRSGHLAGLFTGATIKHLPREKLEKIMVVVPPARLMELFIEQAGPIESQLKLLASTTRRASEARDLLLPRLMSGEIEV